MPPAEVDAGTALLLDQSEIEPRGRSSFRGGSDYPIRQPVPPSTGSATPVTKRASSDAR